MVGSVRTGLDQPKESTMNSTARPLVRSLTLLKEFGER